VCAPRIHRRLERLRLKIELIRSPGGLTVYVRKGPLARRVIAR
jgi:hypothetical protein